MKRRNAISGYLLLLSLLLPLTVSAADGVVQVKGRVTDAANIMQETVEIQLYQLLTQFGVSHNHHLVVITADSAAGYRTEEYLEEVWRQWPSQNKAHSVMLLLLKQEGVALIKAGEETSQHLDKGTIGQIISEKIAPALQHRLYDSAAMDGAVAILGRILH